MRKTWWKCRGKSRKKRGEERRKSRDGEWADVRHEVKKRKGMRERRERDNGWE